MQHIASRLRPFPWMLWTLPLIAALGCGRPDRPELGAVRGTIYLDGKPLDGAIVYFSPEEKGRVSQAMTDDKGMYELVYIGRTNGARTGKHKVRITTAYEGFDKKSGQTIAKHEVVPKRYNSEATELTVDVKPGRNTLDFQLDSKP